MSATGTIRAQKQGSGLTSSFQRNQEDGTFGIVVEVFDRVVSSDGSHRSGDSNVLETAQLKTTSDDVAEIRERKRISDRTRGFGKIE
jgi:hypothetical protein